jgi:hypothetical protein
MGNTNDYNFIIPSWGSGVWDGCAMRRRVDVSFAVFRTLFTEVQKRLLKKSSVYISSLADAPDVVIGYAIIDHSDPPQLHWATVKRGFEGNGIMRGILSAAGISKHDTVAYTFKAVGMHYPKNWLHVPHWLSENV